MLRLEPCVPETDAFFADAEAAVSEMVSAQKADAGGERFPPAAYAASYAALFRQNVSARSSPTVSGVIPKGVRVSDCVPRVLRRLYESDERDWNHRSFAESCALFDELCPDHPELDAKKFWRAGLRGGVQGMLYFADTIDRVNTGF